MLRSSWSLSFMKKRAADPFWASVVLLAQFDEANGATTFTDKTGRHTLTGSNGAATSTSNPPPWAATSLLFDGVNDIVSIADSADWNFGSGDFTVEYMAKNPGGDANSDAMLAQFGSTDKGWAFFENMTGPTLEFDYSTDGTTNITISGTMSGGTWNHRMVSRVGNTLYLGSNGAVIATKDVTGVTFRDSARPLVVGGNNNGTTALYEGNLASVRITKGVGRYSGAVSASYPVPAQPYPTHI